MSASMYGIGDFGWLTMTELIEFVNPAPSAPNVKLETIERSALASGT